MPWRKNLLERDVEPTCSCTDPIAAEWATNKFFADAATSAATPAGYYQAFNNGQAWISGDGFIGHTTIDEYDSGICAAICDSIDECSSFEIYFEKEIGGPAPAIKCSFWAGAITATGSSSANAVIAGCNGYTNSTLTIPNGFDVPVFMAGAAIHPPPTPGAFIGSKIFYGPFDTSNCADECSAVGCKFFNTYVLSKNGVSQGQYCDMYTQPFGPEWATETGKSDGNTNFTISHSFTCGSAGDKRGQDLPNGASSVPPTATPVNSSGTGGSWEEHHPWHGSSPNAGSGANSASGGPSSSKSASSAGPSKASGKPAGSGPGHTGPSPSTSIPISPSNKHPQPGGGTRTTDSSHTTPLKSVSGTPPGKPGNNSGKPTSSSGSSTHISEGDPGHSDPVDATSAGPTNSRPGRPTGNTGNNWGKPTSSSGSSTNISDGDPGHSDPVDATSTRPTNSIPGRPTGSTSNAAPWGRPSSSGANPVKHHPGSTVKVSGVPAASTSNAVPNPGSSEWGDWDAWSTTTYSGQSPTSLPVDPVSQGTSSLSTPDAVSVDPAGTSTPTSPVSINSGSTSHPLPPRSTAASHSEEWLDWTNSKSSIPAISQSTGPTTPQTIAGSTSGRPTNTQPLQTRPSVDPSRPGRPPAYTTTKTSLGNTVAAASTKSYDESQWLDWNEAQSSTTPELSPTTSKKPAAAATTKTSSVPDGRPGRPGQPTRPPVGRPQTTGTTKGSTPTSTTKSTIPAAPAATTKTTTVPNGVPGRPGQPTRPPVGRPQTSPDRGNGGSSDWADWGASVGESSSDILTTTTTTSLKPLEAATTKSTTTSPVGPGRQPITRPTRPVGRPQPTLPRSPTTSSALPVGALTTTSTAEESRSSGHTWPSHSGTEEIWLDWTTSSTTSSSLIVDGLTTTSSPRMGQERSG
ncbi:uncharacterized protein Z520_12371 [Fonsecaea multimorphosa CBS 102226]|uniref:Apple domain-containing protein n=1 Tax=Fonsecaea multimorphosa CBS 102226 TaxID=1442371 RepID=A0A0D2K6B7_9EURO|nr:uncharacterized protein Z520_12371 [Fonsecaea multimorphosa CBS 102226]KIX91908.1 hypothetical protein Z520_12371 [Fonsecaea multimorphosa CBS 102226]